MPLTFNNIPNNAYVVPGDKHVAATQSDPSIKVADAGKMAELVQKHGANLKAEPIHAQDGSVAGFAVWAVKKGPGLWSRIQHALGIDTRRTTAVVAFGQALRNSYAQRADSALIDRMQESLLGSSEVQPSDARAILSTLDSNAASHAQASQVPPHYSPNIMRGPPPPYDPHALRQNPRQYQDHAQLGPPPPYKPLAPRQDSKPQQPRPPHLQGHGVSYGSGISPLQAQALADTGNEIAEAVAKDPGVAETVARVALGFGGLIFHILTKP